MSKAIWAAVVILAVAAVFLYTPMHSITGAQTAEQESHEYATIPEEAYNTSENYEGIIPNTIKVSTIDKSLKFPTRIKFTPDGKHMLVAELQGKVQAYTRINGSWTKQETPFYDLGNINVTGERGLTGLFLGTQNDVFLTYQQFENGKFLNKITRVTLTEQKGTIAGTSAQNIYTSKEQSWSAHQIHDGIAFEYEGKPHILVTLGDGWKPEDAQKPEIEGHGKILLMQRDGTDPLGKRPYPESPKVQAIGIRNVYGILMLPEELDNRRRVLGAENGHYNNDRIWLAEIIDFGHEEDQPVNLGYKGATTGQEWISFLDVNTPGPIDQEAVLQIIEPVASPTSISLHQGKGIIPKPQPGEAVFIMAYYGTTGDTNNTRKQIVMGELYNLRNQPGLKTTPIIQRTEKAIGTYGNLVAAEVDPLTGNIYFSDIMTGELNRAELLD